MRKKSKLSDADRELFQQAMQGVTPLQNANTVIDQPEKRSLKPLAPETEPLLFPSIQENLTAESYLSYQKPGIQAKTLKKLRLGQIKIDDTLDLHGYTQDEALMGMNQIVNQRSHRCVLMIHGKGRSRDLPTLKNLVNAWLKSQTKVLAFCSAKPYHGGNGAVYVLLRK